MTKQTENRTEKKIELFDVSTGIERALGLVEALNQTNGNNLNTTGEAVLWSLRKALLESMELCDQLDTQLAQEWYENRQKQQKEKGGAVQ